MCVCVVDISLRAQDVGAQCHAPRYICVRVCTQAALEDDEALAAAHNTMASSGATKVDAFAAPAAASTSFQVTGPLRA